MSKEYVFGFHGTKEDLLVNLNRFSHTSTYSNNTFYYINDYIVKLIGDEIHFGVARGGHSGGYWYISKITAVEDRLEFRGTIRYIGPGTENRGIFRKFIDIIGEFLMTIFLLPIILLLRCYVFAEWLVRKMINRPNPKEKTNEERLFDLMQNYVGCFRKET